jgi:UDP-N-acetylmuramoyl-L-alanyl-D-glutamate--2,6-diaminopimelate ligase
MNAMVTMTPTQLAAQLRAQLGTAAHLTMDTRGLKQGDIFLAYSVGNERQRTDNRSYIAKALSQGASLVLYEPDALAPEVQVTLNQQCWAIPNLAEFVGPLAHEWYGRPTETMDVLGVTGTNGKTSVTQYLAQALNSLEQKTAVIGTLGAGFLGQLKATGFTTPDAAANHRICQELHQQGAKALAIELSSHALDQGRALGLQVNTAIITNLSQDHLDYHGTMAEYALAKRKILDIPSLTTAIINADDEFGQSCLQYITQRQTQRACKVWAYATDTQAFQNLASLSDASIHHLLATDIQTHTQGMSFELVLDQQSLGRVETSLWGQFNISNLLAVAAALFARDYSVAQVMTALAKIEAVPGRLQRVPNTASQQPMVLIDFAHTPDALQKVLETIQAVAKERQGRLCVVFGCGGDRDPIKRPLMGAIAEQLADLVMLTSDNPRSEDPNSIITQIQSGISQPERVKVNPDRATAILQIIRDAKPQDVILIAGKGHEDTQEIAGQKIPFSDYLHAQLALGGVR